MASASQEHLALGDAASATEHIMGKVKDMLEKEIQPKERELFEKEKLLLERERLLLQREERLTAKEAQLAKREDQFLRSRQQVKAICRSCNLGNWCTRTSCCYDENGFDAHHHSCAQCYAAWKHGSKGRGKNF